MNVDDIIAKTSILASHHTSTDIEHSVYDAMKRELGEQSIQEIEILKENQKLKQEIDQLTQELEIKEEQIDHQTSELETLSAAYKDNNKFMNDRIRQLEAENLTLRTQAREYETEKKKDTIQIQLLQKQNDKLEADLVRKEQDMSYEQLQTRRRCTQLEAENEVLHKQNVDNNFEIHDERVVNAALLDSGLKESVTQLKNSLDYNAANFSRIISKNDVFNVNVDDLRERKKQLESFKLD